MFDPSKFQNNGADSASEISTEAKQSEQLDTDVEDIDYESMEKYNKIVNDKSFMELVKQPLPGSVIATFKDRKMRNSKEMDKWFKHSFLKKTMAVIITSATSIPLYVFFRLVMPHAIAIEKAEEVTKMQKDRDLDDYDVLSGMTGEEIRSRTDFKKIIMKVGMYHPELINHFQSLMTKVGY